MSLLQTKSEVFSHKKHRNQKDADGKPYFRHVEQVANILKQVTTDNNLIAAGYLHDTIEDTDTTYEELEEEFNKDVADLVNEVTHEGKKDNVGYYFPRLKTQRGIMLKFADTLSNLSRMDSFPEKRKQHHLKICKFWKSSPIF